MLHPTIAQQLATQRQQELIDHANRHRQAHIAQATRSIRSAREAPPARTRPYLLRRVHAVLTSH